MVCERIKPWLETHEIERRSQARGRWGRRVNYLRTCHDCHAGPLATMSHAQQLAYKWIHDQGQYRSLDAMVRAWLRIKDPALRAPARVTANEVEHFVNTIQRTRKWSDTEKSH